MTPEILPLTLMHFELVCHGGGPLTLRTEAKQSHQVPRPAAHSLSDINPPSNVLLTKDVCELNSLFRQDPRRHFCTKPLCSAVPAQWAVCVGAQQSWIQSRIQLFFQQLLVPSITNCLWCFILFLQSSPLPARSVRASGRGS